MNKFNNEKEKRKEKNLQKSCSSNNKKENDIFSITNDYLLEKLNFRRNFKNQLSKNKDKKVAHTKNNYSVNYKNNRTINYIPIYSKINSDKREFKKNKLLIKNKSPKNKDINNIEIIHLPIKIIKKYNKTSENENNNKTFLMKKENIYNNINNNFITKKITFPKHSTITLDSSLDNDKKQYNENSFTYNTNPSINNNYYSKINNTCEYEDTISNRNNSRKSPFTIKTASYNLRIKEKNVTNPLHLKEGEEYIKINDNQNEKESIENDISFFYRNSNKTKKNIIQKINLYIKPIQSKSKNKKCRNTFSKNKLLYKKKNNINSLTTMKINDLNNSIESRKNFKEINYIKKPIHKIINCKISKLNREFLEENNNKNKDIKKENEKIIKEIEYININNEIDASFYIIQKDCNFCRYKKYYQFYLRLPIKKNCYLQKIRKHKLIKQYKEFSNNNINGYQLTKNHRKNLILDFFKNGKDDIKEKNISNSYSKNISNFRNENFEVNEIFLFSNNETKFLRKENQDENSKTRSITEEKFAMGCSKLNKILTKNSKINFIVNGLRIAQINSKDNNSKREEEQNRELSANNISEKENGGVENIYKINNSFSKSSETKKNLKGLHYEIKNLLSNNDTSETNESHNHSKHIIIEQNNSNEVLNKNKSEDYFNNIPPNKKPKSKKKSNSKRKK